MNRSIQELGPLLDLADLKEEILNLKEEDWEGNISDYKAMVTREEAYPIPHGDTNTIFLLCNDMTIETGEYIDDNVNVTHKCLGYAKWYPYIKHIVDKLVPTYGKSVARALLVRLKVGGFIAPHVDSGRSLTDCIRIHIPISTNTRVWFTVGDITINMLEGRCYSIDNQAMHSVGNDGTTDRIHLIIDLAPYS